MKPVEGPAETNLHLSHSSSFQGHMNAGEVNTVCCLGAFFLLNTDIGCSGSQKRLLSHSTAMVLTALLVCSDVSFPFPIPALVIHALTYKEAILTLISGSHQGKLLRVLPNLHFTPLGCWNLLPSR